MQKGLFQTMRTDQNKPKNVKKNVIQEESEQIPVSHFTLSTIQNNNKKSCPPFLPVFHHEAKCQ